MNYTLGLDLSLTGTGYAVIDQNTGAIKISGVIKTKPAEWANLTAEMAELERLRKIRTEIELIIQKQLIEVAVIEGLAFMAHQSTALMQLAGLNYLVRDLLYNRKIPFVVVAPSTLKKFVTGKGNSQKDVMLLETYKKWEVTLVNDNECDAYGLARIGQMLIRRDEHTQVEKEVINLLAKQCEPWKNQE